MYTRLTSTLPLISISGDVVRLIRGGWSGVLTFSLLLLSFVSFRCFRRGFISSLYFLVCHLRTLPSLCFVGL
ncbi:hypothetical protein NC652_006248 [Populus alba x Populus x berolinensis]|nr:hypothetical protein NC652_006248 [Populus alba x Populus x berolinensis]